MGADTNVIYTSDHGDNLGARGLWGKSTLYQESVAIPMIAAGPDWSAGVCESPVSLLDLSAEICASFAAPLETANGIKPLRDVATAAPDPERVVFSEYHAVGAVSGGYMLRKGRWKYHYYVGFDPELFDLREDPEELNNLAANPEFADQCAVMEMELRNICDPEAANAQAFADQDAMIEGYGGREAALKLGARGATPPPTRA